MAHGASSKRLIIRDIYRELLEERAAPASAPCHIVSQRPSAHTRAALTKLESATIPLPALIELPFAMHWITCYPISSYSSAPVYSCDTLPSHRLRVLPTRSPYVGSLRWGPVVGATPLLGGVVCFKLPCRCMPLPARGNACAGLPV